MTVSLYIVPTVLPRCLNAPRASNFEQSKVRSKSEKASESHRHRRSKKSRLVANLRTQAFKRLAHKNLSEQISDIDVRSYELEIHQVSSAQLSHFINFSVDMLEFTLCDGKCDGKCHVRLYCQCKRPKGECPALQGLHRLHAHREVQEHSLQVR